jgi:hypothetical protein
MAAKASGRFQRVEGVPLNDSAGTPSSAPKTEYRTIRSPIRTMSSTSGA